MRPNPVWDSGSGAWRVDLRTPWNLGRRVVSAPPPPHGLIEAIHAARDLLEKLRAAAPSGGQLALPGTAGRTLAQSIDVFLHERTWSSCGGERWTRETCDLLIAERGPFELRAFDASALWAYRDEVRARAVGPKAMQSRLIVLKQILRWASEPPRLWIPFVPSFPSPKTSPDEAIDNALTKWIDHQSFRAARARIFEHSTARSALARELRSAGLPDSAADVRDVIERRRLYLSFAFYTGMRRHDLDEIDDAYLSPDFGCYFRHGRKTGAEVAAESIPKPFAADIVAEVRRLGRPFRRGELIAGGPWKNSCRVLETACRVADVDKFNLMDCRRSFVYYKALAGVPMTGTGGLVELMGHKDSGMVRGVYLQLQPRLQRNEAGAAWPEDLTALPGTGSARVINLRGEK